MIANNQLLLCVSLLTLCCQPTQSDDSEETDHYDLMPVSFRGDPKDVRGWMSSIEQLDNLADSEMRGDAQWRIYIFAESGCAMIGASVLKSQSIEGANGGIEESSIVYCAKENAEGGEMRSKAIRIALPESLVKSLGESIRILLLRTNNSNYLENLGRGKPWMLVSADSMQGMAYSPPAAAPIASILSVLEGILISGIKTDHSLDIAAIEKKLENIELRLGADSGYWQILVSDPYSEVHKSEPRMERFDLQRFLFPQP